jgi:hypothetical protein
LRTISPIVSYRSIAQGVKQKRLGYSKGSPDLFIFEPRQGLHGLAIEFKIGKNTQTKEQLDWQAKLSQRGYKYALIYNFDDFQGLIDWYFGKEKGE